MVSPVRRRNTIYLMLLLAGLLAIGYGVVRTTQGSLPEKPLSDLLTALDEKQVASGTFTSDGDRVDWVDARGQRHRTYITGGYAGGSSRVARLAPECLAGLCGVARGALETPRSGPGARSRRFVPGNPGLVPRRASNGRLPGGRDAALRPAGARRRNGSPETGSHRRAGGRRFPGLLQLLDGDDAPDAGARGAASVEFQPKAWRSVLLGRPASPSDDPGLSAGGVGPGPWRVQSQGWHPGLLPARPA